MKKTNNTKTFIGAMMIGFSLLLTGCPQPASGGGENYDEPLPNIVDNLFGDPNWDVTVQGLSASVWRCSCRYSWKSNKACHGHHKLRFFR